MSDMVWTYSTDGTSPLGAPDARMGSSTAPEGGHRGTSEERSLSEEDAENRERWITLKGK
jgi:hypothetical protein